MTFVLQLNASMFPRLHEEKTDVFLKSYIPKSHKVKCIRRVLEAIKEMINEAPPDQGPRRFGNVSFRKWYDVVESKTDVLLTENLPDPITKTSSRTLHEGSPLHELRTYFLGSFGSPQRLDYGTGHELSFLAFLGCIWKLGGFFTDGNTIDERDIVFGILEPYFDLVRELVKTYNLEPAGSHGVWGLDDHFFLPYVFGSAQLSPAIMSPERIPMEGSSSNAPDTGDVTKAAVVETQRQKNLYFAAIGFINDVKKGPFWEHSPMLYDISGVKAGWAKINKGMIKMYMAEVLGKFPVVQHFPFGALFRWEQDPNAAQSTASTKRTNEQQNPSNLNRTGNVRSTTNPGGSQAMKSDNITATKAPWAMNNSNSGSTHGPPTRAPWAKR